MTGISSHLYRFIVGAISGFIISFSLLGIVHFVFFDYYEDIDPLALYIITGLGSLATGFFAMAKGNIQFGIKMKYLLAGLLIGAVVSSIVGVAIKYLVFPSRGLNPFPLFTANAYEKLWLICVIPIGCLLGFSVGLILLHRQRSHSVRVNDNGETTKGQDLL